MSVFLDATQRSSVLGKRKPAGQKPQWYNGALSKKQTISDDFEAYLILQGRDQNKRTLEWLREASNYSIFDSDRDSLLDTFMTNEEKDAENAAFELFPLGDKFNRFKKKFLVAGFESVSEIGQILSDLQRPMLETMYIINKHKHRQIFCKIAHDKLAARGLTNDQKKQLDSWFVPLSAY